MSRNVLAEELLPQKVTLSGVRLPVGLYNMRRPPTEVYLWGELPPRPWVSIVGTRKPSPHGLSSARALARELADRQVTVLSGGALGVDTAAHEGALEAGGRTLVLAPSWYEEAYPAQNRPLFERILKQRGGYLCVNEKGALLRNPAFFSRNEAMMALSDLVVLGECPKKSGARNAIFHAVRLGTPVGVLAFPYATTEAEGSYLEATVRNFPLIFNIETALQLLRERSSWSVPEGAGEILPKPRTRGRRTKKKEEASPAFDLDPTQAKVLTHVRAGATGCEQICAASGLEPSVVQHQILLLTLSGTIAEDESGHLRYTPPHD